MSGLFKKKKFQTNKEDQQQEQKSPQLQQRDGSDSPRPFLLTSGCHGARNPLDWSAMPSALQDKFPHWKESSVPSPLLSQRSPEGGKRRSESTSNKKLSNGSSVPPDCIPYFVMNNDSLVSIALKFDTTTAAIARVNKLPLLGSQPIYPGDLLYIPDSDSVATPPLPLKGKPVTTPTVSSDDVNEDENPLSTEDLKDDFLTKGRSSSLVEIQEEVTEDFVYLSSKFMSEQLCVHGYLVINKQSIMFKPNEEDPLVEDNGADPYEIWLPLDEIVYSYITKEYSAPGSRSSSLQSPTPLATATPDIKKDHTSKDSTQSQNKPLDENEQKILNQDDSLHENEDQNGNVSQSEKGSHSNVDNQVEPTVQNGNEDNSEHNNETDEESHDIVPQVHGTIPSTEGSPSAGASPLLVGGVDRAEPECPSNYESKTYDCNQNENESPKDNQNETESQSLVENENQSADDVFQARPIYERRDTLNSLFQDSFEKSYSSSGEDSAIPIAPTPWHFLYCRLSQSSQQTDAISVVGMKIPVGQGGKKVTVQAVRTWFIFAIPKKRVADIYEFLCKNHPKLKEEFSDQSTMAEPKLINGRLEIINLKGSYSDDSLIMSESHFLEPHSSWEIFSVKDIQPPRIERMNVEEKLPLPFLIEPSKLLSDIHIRKLMPHLVSGAVGHDWCPIYSTFSHGFSLHTLYRNMISYKDNPVLLVVQDSYGKLFGVMVPCPLRISDRFYGTGESFLFTFDGEEISVFPWIGENDYVIKGSPDSIAFGSGDGFFGLWLDENLYHGSSLSCVTYNNRPLATNQDYLIHGVEAWGFV